MMFITTVLLMHQPVYQALFLPKNAAAHVIPTYGRKVSCFKIRGGETSVAMMKNSMAKDWSGPDCNALGLAMFVRFVPLLISRNRETAKELTRPASSRDGRSLVVP